MPKPTVETCPAATTNFANGRKGSRISKIVIHTMQGTYNGTKNWFADPHAGTSAHYGVSFDGKIAQYVQDQDTAWHAGNAQYNKISVGVELEGFEERGYFPEPMLDSLVQLCKYLCETYQIPISRANIIGHCEVPDPATGKPTGGANHHKDPGVSFPWASLMQKLGVNENAGQS